MWETVRLGDVCEIQPKKAQVKAKLAKEDEVSFVPMDDLAIGQLYPIITTKRRLKDVYSSYTYFEDDDILLAKITPCFENGKLGVARNLANGVGFGSSEYLVIRCREQVLAEYLYYHLSQSGFRAEGKKHMRGAVGHKRVPRDFVENYTFQLPPLAEQKRIVERLDKAFVEIDKAIATAEAKEGEAKCLVSEAIKQVFHQSPENKKKKFAEVCVLHRGFDLPKKDRSSGRHPLYSANGITDYISVSKVLGPAVITGRSGTIGEVHYSEKEIWPLNTALYVKDFKGNFPKYVYYFLRSFNLKKYASGTGVPTLNRNVLEHELVYVCEGSDRQEAKCRILDKIEEQAFKISRIQKQQLALLLQLKASILKQELTPSEAV